MLGHALVLVIVDSGSEVTMLPRRFAVPLRVGLDGMVPTTIRGAGGVSVPCYPHVDLQARLCGEWVTLAVRFFATADRANGLLGRAGAFEKLTLAFVHGERLMYAAHTGSAGTSGDLDT
jgi:hypothetical protein